MDNCKLYFFMCLYNTCSIIIKFGNLEILENQRRLEKGGRFILYRILLQDNLSWWKV